MNTKSKPKVSVLIPTFNGGKYIQESIMSVINQTYEKIEIVLIDDHSTDDTWKVVEALISEFTIENITYCCGLEKGLVAALNYGVSICNGELIARMDSDDICHNERISQQIAYLKENTLDVCGSYISIMHGKYIEYVYEYPVSHPAIVEMLKFQNAVAHPSVLAYKSIFVENPYSVEFAHAEDFELWCRLVTKGYIFGNIPKSLIRYRVHGFQVSKQKVEAQKRMGDRIISQYSEKFITQLVEDKNDIALIERERLKSKPTLLNLIIFLANNILSNPIDSLRTIAAITKRYVS
jgi:glycosyltransferase involved in cell wall biosynthesis